jgi:ribosome-binding protein aMBF1 (putative translation factor)
MTTYCPAATAKSRWPDFSGTQIACMGKRADILERFGQRVRELRKEQGYSQESFAAACELDRTYIGGIERRERNVALRNIESIAQALGITLAELMEGL